MTKYYKDRESGYALVLVLMVMLILFMLGTALVGVSTSQVKEAVKQQERVQAYYLAYSGANAVAEWVMSDGAIPEGESALVELGAGSFIVDVVETEDLLTITSSGTVDGYTETVVVGLTRESNNSWGGAPLVDMAVFAVSEGSQASPSLSLNGSRGIVGPVGTNASATNAIAIDPSTNCYINGSFFSRINLSHEGVPEWDPSVVYLKDDEVLYDGKLYIAKWWTQGNVPGLSNAWKLPIHGVSGDHIYLEEERVYPDIVFPTFPDGLSQKDNFTTPWIPSLYYEINEDGQYDLIEVTSSRTLTIDLAGGTRILRVNTFKVEGTVELINVGENGKLMLYVDEKFETSGNRNINVTGDGAGNNNAFNVFLKGNVHFTHTEGAQYNFVGNVVTENGNVDVRAGSSFVGNIFTMNGNVTVSGDATTAGSPILMDGLIYAPNSHVQVLGSGRVSGAVVSDTFFTNGDGPAVTFNFLAQDLDFLPFNIFENSGGGSGNGGNAEAANWVNPVWSGD